jgi:acyl carrier protein
MTEAMSQKIRQVLAEHARLSADLDSLSDSDDLYQAGMTSHSSVNLMLALEDAFDVEFPDALLTRSSFESVDSIGAALTSLRPELAEVA